MPDHDEVVRLYGPWAARTPQDAARLFEGYDRLLLAHPDHPWLRTL